MKENVSGRNANSGAKAEFLAGNLVKTGFAVYVTDYCNSSARDYQGKTGLLLIVFIS